MQGEKENNGSKNGGHYCMFANWKKIPFETNHNQIYVESWKPPLNARLNIQKYEIKIYTADIECKNQEKPYQWWKKWEFFLQFVG